MLPANSLDSTLSNPPFGTQWNGLDDDDVSGEDYRPYLTVDYTLPSTANTYFKILSQLNI